MQSHGDRDRERWSYHFPKGSAGMELALWNKGEAGSLPTQVHLHPVTLGRITCVFCQRGCLHPTLGFAEQHPLRVKALGFSP